MDARLADLLATLAPASARRSPPTPPVRRAATSLRRAILPPRVIGGGTALVATHALQISLTMAAWMTAGAGALSGRVDRGWLMAWALCLASAAVCRLAAIWLEGLLAVEAGGALRQHLLSGVLATDPDLIHRRGSSELLAEVLEAESIERLAIGGGFDTLLSIVELVVAGVALTWGAMAGLQVPLLAGWMLLVGGAAWRNTRLRAAWTGARLSLTAQSIEGMLAHRTRVVQQPPDAWHRAEDRGLEHYLDRSAALDRSSAGLEAILPRGYVLAALMALAPAVVGGTATLVEQAITLGVVLYVGRSLRRLTFGVGHAAAAGIAWRRVAPIADRASTGRPDADAAFASRAATILHVEDVTFAHDGRQEPAVRQSTLTVAQNDVVLLEGDSASGKSTLASLIAGRRRPSSGAILSGGLDPHTAGMRSWRRRVAAVPQYHENHILSASLAFNLLLGRPLPHTAADREEARQVCLELGLGPLLDRMPAGLDQMVGDTGWQLSHGERSRVFLARALLQRPAIVVLDETFAALDPENLRDSVDCVFRRAPAAFVIAHP
jgi:ATP-binding cassette subfamily B protein